MQVSLIIAAVAATASATVQLNATATCSENYDLCGEGKPCCNGLKCYTFTDGVAQCLDHQPAHPTKAHARDAEDAEETLVECINVSVEGDATYCVGGPICGGNGSKCPKKGDVAVKDCVANVRSYVDAAKCVAPEDASCKKLKTGAWGCVWNSKEPQKDAEDANHRCSTNWGQCNGQNWPYGVCCEDPNYQCNKKNNYLSLCEPKDKKRDAEDAEDANHRCSTNWSQCNGQNWPYGVCCEDPNYQCNKKNNYLSLCEPKNKKRDAEDAEDANHRCSTNWSQCNGQNWPYGVCCEDPNFQCNKKNDYLSLCEPKNKKRDAEDDEQSCTNVSVVGDATYCVKGPICGDQGDACPKKGDVAVADCIKTLNSYVDAFKCVAPTDATCQRIPSGARGCVFGAVSPSTEVPPTTPVTTSANNKQCSTNWSQCNGQNWPYGVCCQDPSFQCNKKNEYLSLCEPKDKKRDAEDDEVAVWQQCGGIGYKGDTSCPKGNVCKKINDYYSQCQPDKDVAGQPTWSQCGGKDYRGKTDCREEDKCHKWNDYYSQCVPQ